MLIISNKTSQNLTLPSGVVMLWYGNEAAIPSGWNLYTPAKDKFVRGTTSYVEVGDTGGDASHTHGMPSQTGDGSGSHYHDQTLTTSETGHSPTETNSGARGCSADGHGHSSSSPTSGNSSSHSHSISESGSGSTLPKYNRLYWIISASSETIPEGAILFWSGAVIDIPSNWSVCDGTGSTPDLSGRMIYGADEDGDVGDTYSGLHLHTNSDTDSAGHTHSIGGHTGGPDDTQSAYYSGGNLQSVPHDTHIHYFDGGVSGQGGQHTHTMYDLEEEQVIPPYIKLLCLYADLDKSEYEEGLIVGYSREDIPDGWTLCDGNNGTPDMSDKFILGETASSAGDTGGSATHRHSCPTVAENDGGSHTHGGASGQSGTAILVSQFEEVTRYEGGAYVSAGHYHSCTVTVANEDDVSHSHEVDNSDYESSIPPYVKIRFIMKEASE